MTWETLSDHAEKIVDETLRELPEEVRERLARVPVLIEKEPSPEDIAEGVDPDTLGFFDETIEGVPRIRLWLVNILDYAENDPDVFDEEVRTTLLHEIGHVLGWDEEDLDLRGLG